MNFKKIYTIIIVLLLLGLGIPTKAYGVYGTPKNIEQKKKETKAKIKELKKREKLEINRLYKNQGQLEVEHQNLNISKEQLSNTKIKLNDLQAHCNQASYQYEQMEGNAAQRIRILYKGTYLNVLHLLFESKSINDILDNIYYQQLIIKKDKDVLTEMKRRTDRLAMLRAQVEQEKRNLVYTISYINMKKQKIQDSIEESQYLINKLQTDRKTYERSERELERQSAQVSAMIQKKVTPSSNIHTSGGFLWPITGTITSPFGWRVHPIFKSRTFHSGLDIARPAGTPIKAANSGQVVYVGWYGGYGKVVIIDHGRYNNIPTTTLYAHMSSTAVSNGQRVEKGRVIGYVGTTGYSTGPHCHFEVRLNGKPTNPLNYLR